MKCQRVQKAAIQGLERPCHEDTNKSSPYRIGKEDKGTERLPVAQGVGQIELE